MTKVIIAGYTFETNPSFASVSRERLIMIDVPEDTDKSVLAELQAAESLEVTDRLGREVVGSYRLIGWRRMQTVFRKNDEVRILISWAIPNPDETEKIKDQVEVLSAANTDLEEALIDLASYDQSDNLKQQIEDLTDVILELASYIGEEPEEPEESEEPSDDEAQSDDQEYIPDPPDLDPFYRDAALEENEELVASENIEETNAEEISNEDNSSEVAEEVEDTSLDTN